MEIGDKVEPLLPMKLGRITFCEQPALDSVVVHAGQYAKMQGDVWILEAALREMSLAFDALVAECQDAEGKPKAPSRQALMRSRGFLPPYCAQALAKKTPNAALTRRP